MKGKADNAASLGEDAWRRLESDLHEERMKHKITQQELSDTRDDLLKTRDQNFHLSGDLQGLKEKQRVVDEALDSLSPILDSLSPIHTSPIHTSLDSLSPIHTSLDSLSPIHSLKRMSPASNSPVCRSSIVSSNKTSI